MSKLSSVLQVSPQDIWASSTTIQTDLGALATTGDGRFFRYVKAGGTALVAGTLQQSPAQTTGWQNLTAVAAAVGDFTIASTSTITAAANELAGGLAVISVTPGVGYSYQISGNVAYSAAAPTLALTDPIQVALTTTSRIDLVANKHSGVIINPTTPSGSPVGVAMVATPISNFGWVQVGGYANVLADGTIVVGVPVVCSNATAGAVEPMAGTTIGVQTTVGTGVTAISTTEYGVIDLTLV